MLDLNFKKLTLLLFASMFTNFYILALENQQESDQESVDAPPSLYELIDPAIIAQLKGIEGQTGSTGITGITATGVTGFTGTAGITEFKHSDTHHEESCRMWEKFLVYLYCMEVTGMGVNTMTGKPVIIPRSTYLDQEEVAACRHCLISFSDCCESKIQARKKQDS